MAGFAVEDALLKLAAASLPIGQVLMTFGVLGVIAFSIWAVQSGEAPLSRAMLRPAMILRSLSEVVGRLFFMLAIALTPLSTASAILQATPLVVMVGAVLVFGERIGPRRWLAVTAGFAGVLASPIYQVSPQMGADLIIVVFAVVVIGGLGSIMGSIVTGFGLGIIEGLTKVFYPEASNTVIFIIMAIVLMLRPQGLFGQR